MTNLIPPTAKKQIVLEYWVRVISAWVMVWSFGLLIGAIVLWPTYILISGSTSAYANSVADATERTQQYEAIATTLVQATQQAQSMIVIKQQPALSQVITDVQDQTGQGATISGITVGRTDEGNFSNINLTGIAANRQSLAAFRDRIEELPYVSSVDLPIGNLAENQDITFTIVAIVNEDDV